MMDGQPRGGCRTEKTDKAVVIGLLGDGGAKDSGC